MYAIYEIPIWLWVPIGFLSFSALLFALSIVAGYVEKRPIWPYAEIKPGDPNAPPELLYHQRMAKNVEAKGFVQVGTCLDAKGRLYKVRYEFWLSRERDVLAMVGAGTIAGIAVEATWLYTPQSDGRMVVSTDKQAAMEPAPGDPWQWGLLIDARFPELLAWHRDRAAGDFQQVAPFEPDPARALGRMAKLREERVAGFVASGVGRHRDDQGTSWSYSLSGATRLVTRTYFKGLYDGITQPFRTVRPGGGESQSLTRRPGGPGHGKDRV